MINARRKMQSDKDWSARSVVRAKYAGSVNDRLTKLGKGKDEAG
jgi:hypothetical protein